MSMRLPAHGAGKHAEACAASGIAWAIENYGLEAVLKIDPAHIHQDDPDKCFLARVARCTYYEARKKHGLPNDVLIALGFLAPTSAEVMAGCPFWVTYVELDYAFRYQLTALRAAQSLRRSHAADEGPEPAHERELEFA